MIENVDLKVAEENFWTALSQACFGFNRKLIKDTFLAWAYGDRNQDPWLTHIVLCEARKLGMPWNT